MGAMHPPTSLRVDSIFLVSLIETRLVPTVGRVGGASGRLVNPAPEEAKEVGDEGDTAEAPPEMTPPAVVAAAPAWALALAPTREVSDDLEKAPLL